MGAEGEPLCGDHRLLIPPAGFYDHRLQVVEEKLVGNPSHLPEAFGKPPHEGGPVLAGTEEGLAEAGKSQKHHQKDHAGQAGEGPRLGQTEVHLGLLSGQGLEAHGGPSRELLPHLRHLALDHGVAPRIPQKAQPLVDQGGLHAGPVLEPGPDHLLVIVRLGPPLPSVGAGWVFAQAELLRRPPVDAQPFPYLHVAHALGAHPFCVHPDHLPVHTHPSFLP